MKFTKMHGAGNDYIYVNCFDEIIKDPSRFSIYVSDRHFGIGSDGLVLILPSETADFRMRMFNPDGSESEMCGNAIRCVGKYVYDNKLTALKRINIETLAGIKVLDLYPDADGLISKVRVDMGTPELENAKIPVDYPGVDFIEQEVDVGSMKLSVTCVSMGNPHAVTFVDNTDIFPLNKIGPFMENHILFPKRINAEFVTVISRSEIQMRVWERGTGETLACGTGACASVVASHLTGRTDRDVIVKLKGGELHIQWDEKDGHVKMTGPACRICSGEFDEKWRISNGLC